MEKRFAIALWGSGAALGRALDVSRSYVSRWPERLPRGLAERVLVAAVREGKLEQITKTTLEELT